MNSLANILALARAGAAAPAAILAGVLVAALVAAPAIAADHPLSARRIQLKDKRSLSDGIARNKRSLNLDSSDPALAPAAAGSGADPSVHGAALYLLNADGSGESARVDLPASSWKADGSGWRFRTKTRTGSGTTKIDVSWSDARLRVRIRDKAATALGYSLDENTQGAMSAVLEAGDERWCLEFAAASVTRDEGSVDAACNVRGDFAAGDAAAPPSCPATAGAPTPADACDGWKLLDLLVQGQMEARAIPAVSVAVVRNGEPWYANAWGRRHVGPARPALADTPFMLASISKTVTATAVLQLVDDGVFSLDDDIDDILDFTVDNPRVPGDEVITVRHLLTHTSGLVDDEAVWGGYPGEADSLYVLGDSPIALGDFLRGYFTPGGAWYDASRNFSADPPGTRFEYSNLATALLGYLVEAATGTALDDHSDTRIFAPLAMGDTGWHLADFTASDVAMPYESFGGAFYEWGLYGYPDYPDGQLRASAADLARFLATWASGGILDGVRILDAATVEQALTIQFPAVDASQGLSWYTDSIGGRMVFGHNGGDYGVTTDMFFDPATGHGVIVLINTDETGAVVRAMQRIEEMLFTLAEVG